MLLAAAIASYRVPSLAPRRRALWAAAAAMAAAAIAPVDGLAPIPGPALPAAPQTQTALLSDPSLSGAVLANPAAPPSIAASRPRAASAKVPSSSGSTLCFRASARMANRLIEASERSYWSPDPATLAALQGAADELEDRLEGIAAE